MEKNILTTFYREVIADGDISIGLCRQCLTQIVRYLRGIMVDDNHWYYKSIDVKNVSFENVWQIRCQTCSSYVGKRIPGNEAGFLIDPHRVEEWWCCTDLAEKYLHGEGKNIVFYLLFQFIIFFILFHITEMPDLRGFQQQKANYMGMNCLLNSLEQD